MARYSRRRVTWRDRPLYNTRIPFEDGGSQFNRLHTIKKVAKNELDMHPDKQQHRGSGKRKRTDILKKYGARASYGAYQARRAVNGDLAQGKPITESLAEDFEAVGNYAKSAFSWLSDAMGTGIAEAEELLGAAEVPLLEAGTELAEFGILLMV